MRVPLKDVRPKWKSAAGWAAMGSLFVGLDILADHGDNWPDWFYVISALCWLGQAVRFALTWWRLRGRVAIRLEGRDIKRFEFTPGDFTSAGDDKGEG